MLQSWPLEFIYLCTSNFKFCRDSKVFGQVTDHGLILFRLRGCIAFKKTFCTFGELATLTLLLSQRSNFFDVPLNTFIFFGHPRGDLQSFCVGPGFDSTLPSVSSCTNLRKLRLSPP